MARKSYFAPDDRPSKPLPIKWSLLLLGNMILFFGLYCYFVMRENINWIFWLYYGALAASGLGYIIYNRGLSRQNLTFEMLPNDWTASQKDAFLAERDERRRKSKWLLTIVIPLCFTVLVDVIFLFFGEQLAAFWQTVTAFFGG